MTMWTDPDEPATPERTNCPECDLRRIDARLANIEAALAALLLALGLAAIGYAVGRGFGR